MAQAEGPAPYCNKRIIRRRYSSFAERVNGAITAMKTSAQLIKLYL